jgi:hypothetical protein
MVAEWTELMDEAVEVIEGERMILLSLFLADALAGGTLIVSLMDGCQLRRENLEVVAGPPEFGALATYNIDSDRTGVG